MAGKIWKIAHTAKWLVLPTMLLLWGCGGKSTGDNVVTLTLGAYTVPKEAYERDIIPSFQAYWEEKTGESVTFNESYTASGAQSRAIASGFDADIAALSLEQDVQRLVEAGLITHDWRATQFNGMVTRSIVVMAYREGNPKQITGWEDLTRPDVNVIYPSPKTSGGAMWVVNAIYGAALTHSELRSGQADPDFAYQRLKQIQSRVQVMDKSGRASVTTFENGIGDVLLTYENEVLLRQMQEKAMPFIIPDATILIENPIAVVDKNVEKHGNRELAEAFVTFVKMSQAQRAFAKYGFRPVDPEVAEEFSATFPTPAHLFTIADLGGWSEVHEKLYARDGIWTRIVNELARQ
ncbi:MAG: sulfate ABC transporter substrate-binding protein [Candidatus Marinimicrobia bacterium]|nr:sulfate ABC transporter substrate-binding protein [Candidatus Neomarinimicrobiota bacterium]